MAQSVGSIKFPIKEATHQITVRITGLKGFKVRLWIAARLFRLGAFIAGVNIEIDR